MAWYNFWRKGSGDEQRETLTEQLWPGAYATYQSDTVRLFGLDSTGSNARRAFTIPAFWDAVTLIKGTMSKLPLNVYEDGEVREDHVNRLLAYSPCPGKTSIKVREAFWQDYLTEGRAFLRVERGANRMPLNLWPVPASMVQIERGEDLYLRYRVTLANGAIETIHEMDMIDIAWMPDPDDVGHSSPIQVHSDALGRAIYLNSYATNNFGGGGLPPYTIQGPVGTPDAMGRMTTEIEAAIKTAMSRNRRVFAMPPGYAIVPIAVSARDNQLVEQDRLNTVKVAQIFNLPPVFLQDLSQGTFNNTEQQSLIFVKHTIGPLCEKLEQELLLKLYGRQIRKPIQVRHNLDDVLRGDLQSRTQAFALGIQSGQYTINEVRAIEDRPPIEGGDELVLNSTLKPLELILDPPAPPMMAPGGGDDGDDDEGGMSPEDPAANNGDDV